MESFEFNECSVCLNPHRETRATKDNKVEVRTAEFNGKWGYGVDWMGINEGFCYGVCKDRCVYDNEQDALIAGVKKLISELSRRNVQDKQIFSELNGMMQQELTLF